MKSPRPAASSGSVKHGSALARKVTSLAAAALTAGAPLSSSGFRAQGRVRERSPWNSATMGCGGACC
eukprot:4974-Heterococcus_DN1.PRE.1